MKSQDLTLLPEVFGGTPISLREFFANEAPLSIEFCSGHGHWIVRQAEEEGEKNWIAVEKNFARARKIRSKRKRLQLSNLLVVAGEASQFARSIVEEEILREVYIHFADPWPKRRHHKHRLMQKEFLAVVGRLMQPFGSLTFTTDDEEYLAWTIALLQKEVCFSPLFPSPYFIEDTSHGSGSYFEEMWRKLGRKIYQTRYQKI